MHDLKITLVQSSPLWEDIPANLEYYDRLLKDLETTDLVILPEMFNTGFSTKPEPIAETMEGPTMTWLLKWSAKAGASICGSLIIREDGQYYNRFVIVSPEGDFRSYDKRHRFSMAGEDLTFARGKGRLVVDLKGWKIFPQICYDLRFPAWSKNSWQDGQYEYDLMLYVASWPEIRSLAWKALLPARAVENLSYVAAVSRVGTDGNGIKHSGDSMVIDFLGQPIAALPSHKESIRSVTLSHGELIAFRQRFNVGPDWDRLHIDH